LAEHKDRVAAWLEPIPGEQPAGSDARYEPDHEHIRNQAASLDAPTGGTVDWRDVVQKGGSLLARVSKDILIACYVAYGLYQTEGLRGLAAGLWLIAETCDRFWEDAWPKLKRVRARVNAIDWLTGKVNISLAETQVSAADREAVAALREAAERLKQVAWARFEDSPPSLQPLLDNITRLEMSLPSSPSPSPAPAPAPAPVPAPAPAPAPVPGDESPGYTTEALRARPAPAPATSPAGETSPESLQAKLDQLAAPYLAPIPGPAPAGEDSRYEPAAEAVRAAVAQLDSPTASSVDWAQMVRDCTEILQKKSKDFMIAASLAAALHQQQGFVGLATGVAVLNGLVETYWEEGFPKKKRMRARANAIAWLTSRCAALADAEVKATDREAIALLDHASTKLRTLVYANFEDSVPPLGDLLDNVRRLVLSVPAPEAPSPPQPPPQAPARPQPAQPQAQPQPARPQTQPKVQAPSDAIDEMAGVDQLVPFLQKIGATLHKASRELFKASKASPAAYRLARQGLYLYLDAPPPATSGQQTGAPPPPPDTINQLDTLAQRANWAALLDEAESSLGRHRFWLDLHRYVALALGGLGHAAARDAVIAEVAYLMKRMPEVRERQFSDGQPFAGPATQAWLDAEVLPSGGDGGGGGGDGLSDAERTALDEARKLSAGGKTDEAVAMLDDLSRGGQNASVRFRARLGMAQACAGGGAPAAADGLFTALGIDIERHGLEQWDPGLAAKCYAAHCELLRGQMKKLGEKSDPTMAERFAKVYSRLCRVAPTVALKLGG
jgi:type VI secretion system protein VasJ